MNNHDAEWAFSTFNFEIFTLLLANNGVILKRELVYDTKGISQDTISLIIMLETVPQDQHTIDSSEIAYLAQREEQEKAIYLSLDFRNIYAVIVALFNNIKPIMILKNDDWYKQPRCEINSFKPG